MLEDPATGRGRGGRSTICNGPSACVGTESTPGSYALPSKAAAAAPAAEGDAPGRKLRLLAPIPPSDRAKDLRLIPPDFPPLSWPAAVEAPGSETDPDPWVIDPEPSTRALALRIAAAECSPS